MEYRVECACLRSEWSTLNSVMVLLTNEKRATYSVLSNCWDGSTVILKKYGCFRKWWYPQNTSKWSFLVGKPMVVGETHHCRVHPHVDLGKISFWEKGVWRLPMFGTLRLTLTKVWRFQSFSQKWRLNLRLWTERASGWYQLGKEKERKLL